MRRNIKFILVLSFSWMFVLLYYFQGPGNKVKTKIKFPKHCIIIPLDIPNMWKPWEKALSSSFELSGNMIMKTKTDLNRISKLL